MIIVVVEDWIIVDLDGTLCDCSHRIHHAHAGEWDAFNSELGGDKVFFDVAKLITAFGSLGHRIMAVTGREEKWRHATLKWLAKHDIVFDDLIMRPANDYRPDAVVKIEMLCQHTGASKEELKDKVLFVLDDRDVVVEAWRNLGLRCWQVQPGGY